MTIISVQTQEDGSFKVTMESGDILYVPNDFDNRHRVMIQKWVDAGGVIAPYVAPPESTIPQQNEMIKALWEKARGNSTNFDGLDSKVGF